ncbi:DUF4129 domain-containing protein [Aquimarina sediminis]|uniref:DUF4129 domain-containing protein n=1 Tax=Aquimarina sediminis TaxID=2070536 RepID=UPI000FFF003E|nr:DUF4129 domain-containing protein [Aquimarina sediminis]
MKILYCLLFLIPFSVSSKIQDSTATVSRELIYDSDSSQKIQQFDHQKIVEFLKQDDFDYTEYQEPDNWWIRLKKWLNQLWNKFISWVFGADEVTGFWAIVLKILPYVLVVGVLFLLGWLFMKVNPADMLLEKQQPPQIELTEDEDIIQNQDIQQLINKALQQKNYRLAIRYYYLSILKKLSDQELIQWEAQKTNTDYIKELTDNHMQDQFKSITKLYDFIWYGNFEVNEKAYQKAEKEFTTLTHFIQQ